MASRFNPPHLCLAGIPFSDADGRSSDFHSLRHTLATNLARAGVSPRVAMEFMRHSDLRLTNKVYNAASPLPLHEAVKERVSNHFRVVVGLADAA